jgi:RNA polymerase sigma-70 factor (ECF subfamily)
MLQFEDVIKGCLNNDNKSKEVIYKSFYGYLMAIISRYTNNKIDSEELVNDSFIKVFKSVNKFTYTNADLGLEKSFKAWIARIASRTAIDFLRKKRVFLSIDDVAENVEPITSVNVISELNVKDILKLLNALPETQRLVFNLYEIEGFSHQEISSMLNIPESSSRVYLVRAKQKLRSIYSQTLIHSYETN